MGNTYIEIDQKLISDFKAGHLYLSAEMLFHFHIAPNFPADTFLGIPEIKSETLGGRLPTPSKVFGNNNRDGMAIFTDTQADDHIWTNIPWDETNYTRFQPSIGFTALDGFDSDNSYLCVWPLKEVKSFGKKGVFAFPGEPGSPLIKKGQDFVMDNQTRAALPYYAALHKAAFYKAFIPTKTMMTAARLFFIRVLKNPYETFTVPNAANHGTIDL